MPPLPPFPRILAVTDRHLLAPDPAAVRHRLPAWAAAAARAGVDAIQIRERGLDDGALAALVRDVIGAVAGTGCRVIVNERLDVALATGAAGVHLPASAISAARARLVAPPGFLIGRSVHTTEAAADAARDGGCDYLVFGTVFETESKPAGYRPAGIGALREACAAVGLPVVAIGGVNVERAQEIGRAGASGVAGIRLFLEPWRPGPPQEECRPLEEVVAALDAALSRGRAERFPLAKGLA